jgi:hypothetical protein
VSTVPAPWDHGSECPIWDRDKRIFNVKNFVRYKQVVKIHADGNRSLTPFWKGKLISFGFPGMNIHKETDQKKIFDDITSEIKKMPVATVEERRQYAERAKGLTNLATTTEEVGSVMTNNTNVSASGDDGKRKKKSKSKKGKKRDESSDDSESGYDSEGSASASEAGRDCYFANHAFSANVIKEATIVANIKAIVNSMRHSKRKKDPGREQKSNLLTNQDDNLYDDLDDDDDFVLSVDGGGTLDEDGAEEDEIDYEYHEDTLSVMKGAISTPLGKDIPVWITTDSGSMTQLIQGDYARSLKLPRKALRGRSCFNISSP